MKKFLCVLALAILTAMMATAASTNCVGSSAGPPAGYTIGAALAVGNQFTCGTDTFTTVLVNPSGGMSGATIELLNTSSINGNIEDLVFAIAGGSTDAVGLSGDIQLEYYETGSDVNGLDLQFQASNASGTGNITITDTACSVMVITGCTGTTYGGGSGTSQANGGIGNSINSTFNFTGSFANGVTTPIYIFKDISFTNATTSEVTQSTDLAAPEPLSYLLLGAGLLGLGAFRLKRKKA